MPCSNLFYHFLYHEFFSWYEWWEASGFFVADANSSKPPFVIVTIPSLDNSHTFYTSKLLIQWLINDGLIFL